MSLTDKANGVANNGVLKLAERLLVPGIFGLCVWVLVTLLAVDKNLAVTRDTQTRTVLPGISMLMEDRVKRPRFDTRDAEKLQARLETLIRDLRRDMTTHQTDAVRHGRPR